MPIHEYRCTAGHKFEKMFLTFSAAEEAESKEVSCEAKMSCYAKARRVDFEAPPLPAHFYGNPDGYHKPSPTKRHSTKLVSAKDGNKNSVG
jgi:hypothetical protein